MSILTKVFVVLVSLTSIFLCGVVVVFRANTANWKAAYEQQADLAAAAQVQAVAAEEHLTRTVGRYQTLIEQLKDNLIALEQQSNDHLRQWTLEAQARAQADNKSATAVTLSKSLQETLDNMYAAQLAIQNELTQAHEEMIVAQTQTIEMRRELNDEKVKSSQLDLKRREYLEMIHQLENENAAIRQQLDQVSLASSTFRKANDQVGMTSPAAAGDVPIRGVLTGIDEDLAAISVGSASGVRMGMKFKIVRGDHYLGDLLITRVEPTEAVGKITRRNAVVVEGDAVTTGFD